ncbi:MAG: hypothetical protein E7429_00890 [Ruminococcaceae bacterium]|nr:hypothetical protein [Oscillospiraceae bacterium]
MYKREYSQKIAEVLRTHFEDTLKFVAFDEDVGVFQFTMDMPGRISYVRYLVSIQKKSFSTTVFFPVCPYPMEKAKTATLAELVCRINNDVPEGKFCLNIENGGQITFEMQCDCGGDQDLVEKCCARVYDYALRACYFGGYLWREC